MKKFTAFIVGLVMAVSFLLAAVPAYAEDCPPNSSNPTDIETICNPSPKFFIDFGHDSNNFPALLLFIINALLALVGLVSMVFIMLGGFQYITSRGNEEQAETGKRSLTNAIIGLVVVVMSYIIVTVIVNALFKNV